jgi:transposase
LATDEEMLLMMNPLFEAALGLKSPWYIRQLNFEEANKTLTIEIDFVSGSRFEYPGIAGLHPVHDTQTKRYRHLNFFQHECFLEVRVPRLKLPDGSVKLYEIVWQSSLLK